MEADQAFHQLKRAFTTAPIRIQPNQSLPFVVETDASGGAIGAALLQTSKDGGEHPVVYYSRTLTPSERNYSVSERELLAIRQACIEWRHLMQGAAHPFLVRTDHRNLKILQRMECHNSRHARWAYFFSQFDFKITCHPGKENVLADALSRNLEEDQDDGQRHEEILTGKRILVVVSSFL